MKIVVLNGSPRKGGNTEIMTQAFAEAAHQKFRMRSAFWSSTHEHPWLSGLQMLLELQRANASEDDIGRSF